MMPATLTIVLPHGSIVLPFFAPQPNRIIGFAAHCPRAQHFRPPTMRFADTKKGGLAEAAFYLTDPWW
jgi:hypothetical protein